MKVDLLLIKPNSKKKQYSGFAETLSAIEPPMWAVLLAAYVRDKGFTVSILDAEAENLSNEETIEKIKQISPLLSGIIVSGSNLSASTQAMPGATNLIKEMNLSIPDNITFLWGLHPSALPEKTLREENVNFVIQGEGFTTTVELIESLKKGISNENYKNIKGLCFREKNEIICNERSPLIEDLDSLPMCAWDLLPMDKYRAHNWHCFDDLDKRDTYAVIYTSLGCPFDCYFCALKALFGKPRVRYRSPESVIEEIDLLVKKYNVRNFKILDECFVLNRRHVEAICDLLIERNYNLNIWAYARVDTIDKELLEKLKKAGITWIALGIESGSKKVRQEVKKRDYSQDKIYESVKMINDAGIYIVANFIFGLPDDDIETMTETLDMAKELNAEYSNFYVAVAYPGSQLYEDALKNEIPLPDSWLGYAQFSEETFPLPTNHLTGAQVLKFRDDAFHDYHSSSRYLNMIKEKFGDKTVQHINQMMEFKINRKYI